MIFLCFLSLKPFLCWWQYQREPTKRLLLLFCFSSFSLNLPSRLPSSDTPMRKFNASSAWPALAAHPWKWNGENQVSKDEPSNLPLNAGGGKGEDRSLSFAREISFAYSCVAYLPKQNHSDILDGLFSLLSHLPENLYVVKYHTHTHTHISVSKCKCFSTYIFKNFKNFFTRYLT